MGKTCLLCMFLLLAAPFSVSAGTQVGDVNGDGEISVADLNYVFNIILGGNGDHDAADVNGDGEITIADGNAIINAILGFPSPSDDGREYVDLGLPSGTLWATMNVGATRPEEFGDYFAWGETAPKDEYTWENYKWCNGNQWELTKYCMVSDKGYNGFVDDKAELDPEDDAAYVNWGPLWRMPTYEQACELLDNCTSQLTYRNDIYGVLVTGPNGNTLFFPLEDDGWWENGGGWWEPQYWVWIDAWYCGFWTCTLTTDEDYENVIIDAYSFSYYKLDGSCGQGGGGLSRHLGSTVRPVRVSQY